MPANQVGKGVGDCRVQALLRVVVDLGRAQPGVDLGGLFNIL